MLFYCVSIFSALVTVCVCATTVPTTTPGGCVYNGKVYHAGQSFQPSPCEHCFCSPDGQTPCAIADCFITPCVDAVHDPTKCCPVCPNGPNCQTQDGTIIKQGDVYRPDANTLCSCPSHSFMMSGPFAVCAVTDISPLVPVDPVDPSQTVS